jgi:sodium/hydrogen antiporter
VALGAGGALLLRWSTGKGWSARHWQSVALLALAALAFVLADAIEGSGFIAAWMAGLAAGRTARGTLAQAQQTPEELANLAVSVSFVLFGALFLAPALAGVSWRAVTYALLSLSVIRMVPVAVALLGSGLARPTVVYIGWFGRRGLASIVFADLAATSGLPEQALIVQVVMVTVGLSVVLHGVTRTMGGAALRELVRGRGRAGPRGQRGRRGTPGDPPRPGSPRPCGPLRGARGGPGSHSLGVMPRRPRPLYGQAVQGRERGW